MRNPIIITGLAVSALTIGLMIWAAWPGSDHNVMVAEGTFALALVTFWLVIVAFNEMQEGRRRTQETQRASLRPLLIPVSALGLGPDPDEGAFWRKAEHIIRIKNVGNGVATNVQGVMLPRIDAGLRTEALHSTRCFRPIGTGEDGLDGHFTWGIIPMSRDAQIKGVPLSALREDRNRYCLLRLTLTYWDILGLRHASIFDLVGNVPLNAGLPLNTQELIWEQVAILPKEVLGDDITQDLCELSPPRIVEDVEAPWGHLLGVSQDTK